jgi:hypothetical protein
MKRTICGFLIAILIAATTSASSVGIAVAEPGKNQISAQTSSCSDGQDYAFVLNAMGKAWQIEGSNANLVVKRYALTYFDPVSGELIGRDTYDSGNKSGLGRDLISCTGEVTTELEGLGLVRVVAEFNAFVTPRGA